MAEYNMVGKPTSTSKLKVDDISTIVKKTPIKIVAFGNLAFDQKKDATHPKYKTTTECLVETSTGTEFNKAWKEVETDIETSMGGSVANSLTVSRYLGGQETEVFMIPFFDAHKDYKKTLKERTTNTGIQFLPMLPGEGQISAKILATANGKKMHTEFLTMPDDKQTAKQQLQKSIDSLNLNETRNIILFEGYHANDGRSLEFLQKVLVKIDPKKDVGFFTISGSFIHEFCDSEGLHSQLIVDAMEKGKLSVISGDKLEHAALFAKTEYAGKPMEEISKKIPNVLFIETDGANGINLYINGQTIHSSGIPFKGIPETTGCGDSVAGTFIWGIEQIIANGESLFSVQEKLEYLADLANAIGHATCGTQQATLTGDEINANSLIKEAKEIFCDVLAGKDVMQRKKQWLEKTRPATVKTQII